MLTVDRIKKKKKTIENVIPCLNTIYYYIMYLVIIKLFGQPIVHRSCFDHFIVHEREIVAYHCFTILLVINKTQMR